MNETHVRADEIPQLTRTEAESLATSMYERMITELGRLSDSEWEAETSCRPWTVADIARHLIGAAEGHASLPRFARQAVHGARHKGEFGGNDMDAMNDLQVRDHAHLGGSGLVAALRDVAPRAVRKRMRRPALIRRIRIPIAPGGSTAAGMPESLTLGHLFDVILTRDVLVHRIDVARATGRELAVDEREGRLVADVVAEWSQRHGRPFRLHLSGPAGGRYAAGEGGPELELDAIEFCWILSGRGAASHPLLDVRVLF